MSKKRKKHKTLYIDTSIRNPERLKNFLLILSRHEGKILTETLAVQIEKEVIMDGHYRPNVKSKNSTKHLADKGQFTNTEAELIMKHHPQKHTHYGWKNWGGRFGTHFHNPQQLGYCFCMPEKKIAIGETGKKLISLSNEEKYKLQNIHLNALVNFQSNNPISGNLNENRPLILLIKLIKHAKELTQESITTNEIPLIMSWKNDNEKELFELITEYRKEKKQLKKPTIEKNNFLVFKYCTKIFGDKLTKNDKGKYNLYGEGKDIDTIIKEYPDVYKRFMRLSGLVYKKKHKGKSFLDYDNQKLAKYIVENFKVKKFKNEEEYFQHSSKLDYFIYDENIVEKLSEEQHLEKWTKILGYETIKTQLLNLMNKNVRREHEILKDIDNSLLLEWMLCLFCYSNLKGKIKKIEPKYHVNEDGQASNCANGMRGGNSGVDAIIFENGSFFTLEPTLKTANLQYRDESQSCQDHLEFEINNNPGKEAYCFIISPEPSHRLIRWAKNEKKDNNLNIIPISIKEFVEKLENKKSLKSLI